MTVTLPAALAAPPDLAPSWPAFSNVDTWTSAVEPAEACGLDYTHGPAIVFLTIHGDTCRSYAVCGRCAVELVAPLPNNELVDAAGDAYEAQLWGAS